MKRVVSVSLGSSSRDHRFETTILGQPIVIERIGTDGDVARARRLLEELDGKVDALGLGGTDLYLRAGRRQYLIRETAGLVRNIRRTPFVDGGGLKASWERWLITDYLPKQKGLSFKGRRVVLVSSVDRYGMAEAFVEAGAEVIFGDLIFALGIPIPLRSLVSVQVLAAILLPVLSRLPIKYLYPTGKRQEQITPRYQRYFRWAEVLAGDFHLIRRYMPDDLRGRIVLTQTITPTDVEELRRRGVWMLITDGPDMGGRSFATNVLQGVIVAVTGKRPEEITPAEYLETALRAGFLPRMEELNPREAPRAWRREPAAV
ncbi:MAG: quinate 5-dehydrogenase [Armatimonadota bacterium]|nr:quinate 5-dehydrogenase [Armatimonadota bacterium]MDR7451622.1 quinate 5-dehydrogenase [Armatimonadota bacterium]MDR7467658.1 quinate 5-dehydrogenase [Armatimonadota bacterium]MDR7492591.1 quinate 5-dehydrogenase [Armatimonadota bacterium]MDR7499941.1 quinate 5-dehydrogenase [Armatimonadota bacterium]